ncbi:exonuclease 3'-5' domain-containing protein 2 isoform X1 [Bufo bufo]|uniref:exonuclease 3'-5' domain-containing protein 2 isoform X1 n=2 Tax=Bufo bufo TaxID=8384 RepID=UPI001ABE8D80|nr:exonuclease 3'-5' domain-containing protein 2 isoform X1 [Bufo bufo]XP_040268084.1 exonuclease 3'-5' domain-containing protein 2 isoform X1 [Bufo bufo]XP_040268085.1 exonuclease 3'-5' domain-containing protein 2 isoform X1 [Bufo bufo]
MPRHAGLTLGVASLVGTTVGCLILWKLINRRRQQLYTGVDQKNSCTGLTPEVQDLDDSVRQPLERKRSLLSVEKILQAEVRIVSTAEEWETVWLLLQRDLDVYPVLGVDCEWVSLEGRIKPISLLQMASHSGLCVLVRLPRLAGCSLPKTLVALLEDCRVLKVGLGCWDDASKLMNDYGLSVKGVVDIRYLAIRHRRDIFQNSLSLKYLSETILSYPLDKSFQLRCSNWDADEFTQDQVFYAARDAQVSIALFLQLLGFFSSDPPTAWEFFLGKCQGLIDVPFKGKGVVNGDVNIIPKQKKESPIEQSSPNSQGDSHRHKKKPLGVGYSVRKSPLYDNCFLHAPDGQPLCTCDRKKAQWYLDKGIGDLISNDPFVVRLRFEPSGRPESSVDYYLTVKENLCVVCGKRESYIRKNIVPHEYRRHFPVQLKDHNSHDVLLLCTSCHAVSNYYDNYLKQQLAMEFSAPIGCEEGVRILEDPVRRQVRSAARALLNASKLPESRREELLSEMRTFYSTDEVTEETLNTAANLETRIFNETYTPHGLKVVQCFAKGGLKSLMELEKRWRQHFLDKMAPKFLPQQWSVDHNHRKLIRKYGEDLPIQLG